MRQLEILTLVISGVAMLISAAALWASMAAARKANKASREAIATQHAQTEFQIRVEIRSCSERLQTLMVASATSGNLDPASKQAFQAAVRSAMENYLNAYETACGAYRDKKIDRVRFKKSYQRELRQLVADHSFREFLFPEATSAFKAIHAVHEEWENTEKG
jgi:heme oxygenase